MIDALGRRGEWKQAKLLMSEMNTPRLQPDIASYTALLRALAMRGEMEAVLEMLNVMNESGIAPNERTFSVLIDSFGKAELFDVMKATFLAMKRSGIIASQFSFNSMIHHCGRAGLLNDVLHLYHEMLDKKITPDVFTYHSLISALLKANQFQKAGQFFFQMQESGIVPDEPIYALMMTMLATKGQIHEMEQLLGEMAKFNVKPAARTYTALIKGYGSANLFEKAMDTFKTLQKENLPISVELMDNVILLCATHKRIDILEQFFQQQMQYQIQKEKQQEQELQQSRKSHIQLDNNILLKFQKEFSLFTNVYMFASLLEAFCVCKCFHRVIFMLNLLIDNRKLLWLNQKSWQFISAKLSALANLVQHSDISNMMVLMMKNIRKQLKEPKTDISLLTGKQYSQWKELETCIMSSHLNSPSTKGNL